MKLDGKIGSGWGFQCGALLPEEEIDVLAAFLTCKDPEKHTEATRADGEARELTDPSESKNQRLSMYEQRESLAHPWTQSAGGVNEPIEIPDTEEAFGHLLTPRRMENNSRYITTPSNDNSITVDPPRYPGPEPVHRRSSTARRSSVDPIMRPATEKRAFNNRDMGVELHKVFENEEFVTFRKMPYRGKPPTAFAMRDSEDSFLRDGVCPSKRNTESSHQVLVVTRKKY